MFNRRKNNETTIEPAEGNNDEEMLYNSTDDVPSFESFPREFGKSNFVFSISLNMLQINLNILRFYLIY